MKKYFLKKEEKIEKICKGVSIIQDDSLPKFSIDPFLLIAFIDKYKSKRLKVADFGAGTGIVGILFSRLNFSHIDLIEINRKLFLLEKKNVSLNKIGSRVKCWNIDINRLGYNFPINYFDLIISNPPYFDKKNYKKNNPNFNRNLTKHEGFLDFNKLVLSAKKFLKNKGKFYFIFRSERLNEIFEVLRENNFGIDRIRFVYGLQGSISKLVLVKAIKQSSSAKLKIESPLNIFLKNGHYSPEVKKALYIKE